MKIDVTQPWVETKDKLPKFGGVLEALLDLERKRTIKQEAINNDLTTVETNVNAALNSFDSDLNTLTAAHIAKRGVTAHGETKATIGLPDKENLPAAKLTDINNKSFKREFLTPKTMHALVDQDLAVDEGLYIKSGAFPLSYGVTLGRAIFNQRYINPTSAVGNASPAGVSQALLSTEEGYILFADQAGGYDTDFSEGGIRAPIGTTLLSTPNGKLTSIKGTPASLNDITATDLFIATQTGREFGFTNNRGNYFDSNFHPSVVVQPTKLNSSPRQSFESTLFDGSVIYKPDGTYIFRNFDLTKHNFTEMVPLMTGLFPFNNTTLLSADEFMMHTANCRMVQEGGAWGIEFDIMSGSVGIPDWLPSSLRKGTNKILSKRAEYVIRQTTVSSVSNLSGATSYIRLSTGKIPVGFSVNRSNFDDSNFNNSPRYASVFVPLNSLIRNFNTLTAAQQTAFVNRIDKDLLKRITLAWDNKFTLTGLMRIPLYVTSATASDVAWNMWLDFSFTFNVGPDYTQVAFTAINFDSATLPTLDANQNLTGALGKWKQHTRSLLNNPTHPKVFGGCFAETGGHLRTYTIGHRQYICYYTHQITSIKNWIKNDMTPVITNTEIKDIGLFPSNGFYGDTLRQIPVITEADKTTYLGYLRNKKGKYQFATFTLDPNFDLKATGVANPSNVTWLERAGEKDLPILVSSTAQNSTSLNISGMVFSEANGFTGSFNPSFDVNGFAPVNPTTIDPVFKERLIINSKILNPYAIFFYYESVLHWVIMDKYGISNSEGKDVCFGGARVDVYPNGDGTYEIRQLPTMVETNVWGKLFSKPLDDGYYGRNQETFDDVFIVKSELGVTALNVFVNYPGLVGKYFKYTINRDGLGYFYPGAFLGGTIDIAALCGSGVKTPHTFYPSYPAPLFTPKHFYHFTQTLYEFDDYSASGVSGQTDYYMGWKNEFPLYLVGSAITVNGRSLLVDKTIKLTDYATNRGAVFITYLEDFITYTSQNNPDGHPTEPSIATIFAGFWGLVGSVYAFSYHAERGIAAVEYADFLNGLLPVVDGKQMSPNKMGSTFPLYLGKLSQTPVQYYFKK